MPQMWPRGEKIREYLQEKIRELKPEAILLDFLNYKYDWGNEIMGPILLASLDPNSTRIRPCSVLAMGRTAKALKSLLVEGNVDKILNIKLFSEKKEALEHLKKGLARLC